MLNTLHYIGAEDLLGKLTIENESVDIEMFQTKTGEITFNAYHVSVSELVGVCQIGSDALLGINDYMLGILWGRQCFYLFDSHSKDKDGKVSPNDAVVLMKFESLNLKTIYVNTNRTLHFPLQLIKVLFAQGTKGLIFAHLIKYRTVARNARKKGSYEDLTKIQQKLRTQKVRYNPDPEKKKQTEKRNKVQIRLKRRNNMKIQSQRNRLEKQSPAKIQNLRNRHKKIVKILNLRNKQ